MTVLDMLAGLDGRSLGIAVLAFAVWFGTRK